jgi:hypothetical protein
MPNQSLGIYEFPWNPDKYTVPKPEKFWGRVQTYSSVAFFSFGVTIVGKEIVLEWNWMSADQFAALDSIYRSDASVIWDPQDGDGLLYRAEILGFDGEYFEVVGTDFIYRKNVKLTLMITEEMTGS